MKVILQKNIGRKGSSGDVVEVAEGYARNYLLPNGFAILADEGKVKAMQHNKKVIQDKINQEKKSAQKLADKLSTHSCTIAKKVGEEEKLFGSVTTSDIEAALKRDGFDISKKDIVLEDHIRALGIYTVPVKVATGIEAHLKVWVVKE
ncbi:MAG: 50S ribosomal protein L9 [bacterium]